VSACNSGAYVFARSAICCRLVCVDCARAVAHMCCLPVCCYVPDAVPPLACAQELWSCCVFPLPQRRVRHAFHPGMALLVEA